MKLPICGDCLEADKLCSACEGKISSGEIQHSDVELARALHKLSFAHPQVEKSEISKTHSHDDLMIIEVPRGGAGHIIGKKGAIIKELSSSMQKRIKVIEETTDKRDFIKKVLHPAELKGLTVGTSNRKQVYKIRLRNIDMSRIGNTKPFEKLFEKILKGKTEIVFE